MAMYVNYVDPKDVKYEVMPGGMHEFLVTGVTFDGEGKFGPQWEIMLETTKLHREDGSVFKRRTWIGTNYGPDKANLTKSLDNLYGRRFSRSEMEDFHLRAIDGCRVNALVERIIKDGSESDKVGRVLYAADSETYPLPPNASNGKAAPPAAAADDEEPPVLTEKQRASLAKRLKLSEDEAQSMDIRGRMPGDEGYDPYEGDN